MELEGKRKVIQVVHEQAEVIEAVERDVSVEK